MPHPPNPQGQISSSQKLEDPPDLHVALPEIADPPVESPVYFL